MNSRRSKRHSAAGSRIPGGRGYLALLVVVTALLSPLIADSAPTIVRGPYLQNLTQTSVVVRWRTDIPATSLVAYGTKPVQLLSTVSSPVLQTNHSLLLPDLEQGTRYYYAVGHETEILEWGPAYHVETAPAQPGPVRIWAIGDSGSASAGQPGSRLVRDAYMSYAAAQPADLWLMLGDNAYSVGTDDEYQVAVFDLFHDLLLHTPLWSTIGNHETYAPLEGNRFAYLDIFDLPDQGEAGGVPSGTIRYYSFDYANIHFVCLDSETSYRGQDGAMLTWLEADLTANTKEWVIAYWHSPPYSKGSHDSDNPFDSAGRLFDMRTNAVPVLEAYGVDLVLCGHSHNYERSYLLKGHYGLSSTLEAAMILDGGSGRTNEGGAYLKTGQGPDGNSGTVYVVAGSSGWATFATGRHPAMYSQILQLGSLIIDVDGSRLDARFLRETGAIDDYFTIIKGAAPESFRIVHFQQTGADSILEWKSKPGGAYQVEWTESISPAEWIEASGILEATGRTTRWTNSFLPPEISAGYYRIRETTPASR